MKVYFHRAAPETSAAAHTEKNAMVLLEVVELMIIPLLESFSFCISGVFSRSHFGEIGEAASIPESYSFTIFIGDVKTMTGGAKVATDTAAYALKARLIPIRIPKTVD